MEKFGQNIFMSIGVIKEVAWATIVYLPSMMAFASAFHCFLLGDPIFESWITSALKVLTMVIGEYNFDHHFAYHAVKSNGGRNISIQVF